MKLLLTELSPPERQGWLQHAIGPRPVALVSTMNKKGEVNLAPFSFFNLFSIEPPIVIFSPVRKLRDGSTKHTLDNLSDTIKEAVIHIVTDDMVQQVSLASCEYPEGVDEFIKAGFTKIEASMVRPPMVKESPVKLECTIKTLIPLGPQAGGAGTLVIAEVCCMHVDENILNTEKTMIDQQKLKHIARLGGDWYCRVSPENLFKVEKPNRKLGIGIDALPENIRTSLILTGNHLAQLANVEQLPAKADEYKSDLFFMKLRSITDKQQRINEIHRHAMHLINEGKTGEAWQVLLMEMG